MPDFSPIEVPDLSGKVFLVTGAGRGIGAVLCGLLSAAGAKAYAGLFREAEPAWADHLSAAFPVRLDVTSQSDVDHALSRIRDESGRLDGLANNAGAVTPISRADGLCSDGLRRAFEVNAVGVHRVTRAALPMLRASRGVVVNAGTGAATTPLEGWAAYCSSKAALRMMTQVFAMEEEKGEVRFFFLGIPPTDTSMQAEIRASGINPISRIPRSELAAPQVAASAMAWLFGPQARALEQVALDVRDDLFRKMMGLPVPRTPSE